MPSQPLLHRHAPTLKSQVPWEWQRPRLVVGQSGSWQARPVHPTAHLQAPVVWLQKPWLLHMPGHSRWLQSLAVHPGSHLHLPAEHSPWEEQLLGQEERWQWPP